MYIIISLQGNIVLQNNTHNNITSREHCTAKQYAYKYHLKGTLYAYIQNNHVHFLPVLVITNIYQFGAKRLNERARKGNGTYEDTTAEATACKYACMHIWVHACIHLHNSCVRMCEHCNNEAIPCPMLLVSGLEIRVHGFNPRPINVGILVDKMAPVRFSL